MKKETLKKRKETLKKRKERRKQSRNEEVNTEKQRKENFYKKIVRKQSKK